MRLTSGGPTRWDVSWARPGAALLLCVLFSGCVTAQRPDPGALCTLRLPPEAQGEPTTDTWLSLLLYQYEPGRRGLVGPALDCTGTPLTWQDMDEGCGQAGGEQHAGAVRFGPEVRVQPVDANHRLVWAQILRFNDGEVLGPVGLVETSPAGLAVETLGSLRAEPDRVQLKLVHLGSAPALWVESEYCPGHDRAGCRRAVRVLPLRVRRFIQEPLRTAAGECAGPAWFPLERVEQRRRPGGWIRSYVLQTTVDPRPEGLLVHEQLTVREQDAQKDAPPRLLRSAQADRTVLLNAEGLVVNRPSLWGSLPERDVGD